MKLRPFLRSLSSSQVSTSIEEKNKLKPDAEQNNILSRRKKSSERRLGLKDIGSLQEVMEDRTEAPDKQSEYQRNDQANEGKVNFVNTFCCKDEHKLLQNRTEVVNVVRKILPSTLCKLILKVCGVVIMETSILPTLTYLDRVPYF